MRWRGVQLPAASEEVGRGRELWGAVVALVIAVAGPLGWAARSDASAASLALVVLAGVVAVLVARRLRPPALAVGTVLAAVAGGAVVGWVTVPVCGIWFVTSAVVSRVVAGPVGRSLWVRVPGQGRVAALVLAVVAGVNAALGHGVVVVGVAAVATVVVPLLLGRGHALVWVDRFARGVGGVLTRVLFSVAAVFLVVVPHLLSRVFRTDLLATSGRWDRPARSRSGAGAVWADDRPRPQRVLEGRHLVWRRVVRASVIPLVLVVAAGALWFHRQHRPTSRDPFVLANTATETRGEREDELREPAPDGLSADPADPSGLPAAQVGNDWWSTPAFKNGEAFAFDATGPWRNENPYRFLDLRSEYVNIVNGLRRSWRPPACDCRRLKVWVYGGSTTWGIGQRDEHTIASELARIAHEHGITVDVDNRGITGFTHWHEAERLAYDLTVGPAPDLVVFYDGVNEIYQGNGDNDIRATNEAPVDSALRALWDGSGRSRPPVPHRDGSKVLDDEYDPPSVTRRSTDIVARYDRTRESSAATAREAGVEVRYFWQPQRYSRPLIDGEPHWETWQENDMRLVNQVTVDNLPEDVVDLSDVLDSNRDPIYTDDVHHNELGARIIAAAIYDHLAPDLKRLHRADP